MATNHKSAKLPNILITAKKRSLYLWLLILFLNLLSGCYDAEDIDQRMIISPVGLDSGPENKIFLTVKLPIITSGGEVSSQPNRKQSSQIIRKTLCTSVLEGLSDIQSREEHSLFIGQCRTIVFGEALAKKGLKPYLDYFNRLPTFPPNAFIVIARPGAEELLKIDWPEIEFHAQNIRLFFSNRENEFLPIKRWSLFHELTEPLQDPVIPLVTPSDDNTTMKALGLALIKNDQFIGELNNTESVLLCFLKNNHQKYRLKIPFGTPISTVFQLVTGKTGLKVIYRNNLPQFNFRVKIKASMGELGGYQSPVSMKDLKKIEEISSRYLQKEFMALLGKLQALGCDPIYLGENFRIQQPKYFTIGQWPENFRQAKFQVSVKFSIERLGVLQ